MRIVTLLPAATEIVAALGAIDELVAVSHECDHPAAVAGRPRITVTPIDVSRPGAEIDAEVRRLRAAGRPVIGVDATALRALAPDLIVTQALCDVCAVADGEVVALARALDPVPRVLTLGGRTLAAVLDDIRAVGEAIGCRGEATRLVAGLATRLGALAEGRPARAPRVLCIEWLEPPYVAGHWVPDLVAAAGGVDVAARSGDHSRVVPWGELRALAPDVIVVALCGFGTSRAREELARLTDPDALALLAGAPVWLLDGNAYTSRPGPRLVDAAELLAGLLRGAPSGELVRWRVPAGAHA
ncbi:MAG TPA: ABC transporter substrate-binding protein [Gemmatimonadales bacterium]|nr:ABC transporter substrate-binding protein [Gemmatimonadales bacterium]